MRSFKSLYVVFLFLILVNSMTLFAMQEPGQERVNIRNRKFTVFSLLGEITRQTSYFFIYDSRLIDNNREITIQKGTYTINEMMGMVLPDSLRYNILEKYIIIHVPTLTETDGTITGTDVNATDSLSVVLRGRVVDAENQAPLSFASVALLRRGKGTAANEDGVFSFKTISESIDDTLKISYLGYTSRLIPVKLLLEKTTDIYMEMKSLPLQEVVVRGINPIDILYQAITNIPDNYPPYPSMQNSFYREGIFKNDELLHYSEAVFNIFKSAYAGVTGDQVKLIRSRNIQNSLNRDTLIIKLKAGIKSMLELDVIKHPPGFLMHEDMGLYKFTESQLVAYDKGYAYAISFATADFTDEGIYEGTLYIDQNTLAIVQVDFSIAQSYLRKNQNHFITRKSKMHTTRIREMNYSVRYACYNGKYHIQHIRGEIDLRIRQHRKLFGNSYNAFFEMAVMDIQTEDVKRFPRREVQKPNVIFADQEFEYDVAFWENFNFIIPEASITKAINNFDAEIEQVEED